MKKVSQQTVKAILAKSRTIEQCNTYELMVSGRMYDMDMQWGFFNEPNLN